MNLTPKQLSNIGNGAEFVISGKDSIIIISGGNILEICVVSQDKNQASVICSDGEISTTLFTGSLLDAVIHYKQLTKKFSKLGKPSWLSIVKSVSITVASIIVIILGGLFIYESHFLDNTITPPTSPIMQNGMPLTSNALPSELSFLNPIEEDTTSTPSLDPQLQYDEPVTELKMVEKPKFLSEIDIKSETSKTPDLVDQSDTIEPQTKIAFPPYNPKGLEPTSNDIPEQVESSSLSSTAPESTKAVHEQGENHSSSTEQPTTDVAQESDEIKQQADTAISNLIDRGIDENSIRELLLQLQALNSEGSENITPEMLQSLPEEIASMLIDQGMDLSSDSAGAIRILPSEVVDQFRGPDGVATIPENHSWYARMGGVISIPLPGGGDIKKPEDMLEFGFQP